MLLDEFSTYMRCERNLSAHTVASYMGDLYQWADFMTGGRREELNALDVSTSDLRQWIALLGRKGVSARTVKRKVAALASLYKFLMKRHGLKVNPVNDIIVARPHKALPAVIPAAQTRAVLDTEPDADDYCAVRDHLIVEMLYETGLRASELASLRESNVNIQGHTIKVRGKRNKERIVPIGDSLAAEIEAYRRQRDEECLKQSGAEDCFFLKHDGGQISYEIVRKAVHTALDGNVTAAKRTPHVLRHSFATDMLNSGAELNSVKELLGHQSLETTQIYTHISLSDLKHNYEQAHPRALKKGGHHGSKNPSNPL